MASPTWKQKGKGRVADSARSTYYEASPEDDDETDTTADYETALESALYDQRSSSTNRYHEGHNGHASHVAEDDQEFVYDGKDDEDMNVFREDANFESLDYKERLRGALGDAEVLEATVYDEMPDPPTPHLPAVPAANGPTMSTPPRSPSDSIHTISPSPSTMRRPDGIDDHQAISPPSSPLLRRPIPSSLPFPRPKARPPSVSSPSSSTNSSSFLLDSSHLSSLPSSSRLGNLSSRRPPLNPLVSRLRSTSATPSQSFRGLRSTSQASSLASLALQDTEDLHGFADDTLAQDANTTFASGRNGDLRLPSFTGSRQSSSSNLERAAQGGMDMTPSTSVHMRNGNDTDATALPEAHQLVPPLKWTVLKRLSQRLFSHPSNNGKSSSVLADPGGPTCLAVAGGLIVIGTARGWTMIYDYSQSLKAIAGNDEISKQCGAVTAVALSLDSTFIAVAYESSHIHLFEWGKKPGTPARTVNPTSLPAVNTGKAEGHLARDTSGHGSHIEYIAFVGRRHTAIISGDQYGLAFYHSLGKVFGLANTDILRILGRYPLQLGAVPSEGLSVESHTPAPHSRLFGLQSLPLGTEEKSVDEFSLVALLTAGKLVIAGLKPTPKTWWRYVNQSQSSNEQVKEDRQAPSSRSSEAYLDTPHLSDGERTRLPNSGCLAWLPSIDGSSPLLAWCWRGTLRIAVVEEGYSEARPADRPEGPRRVRNIDVPKSRQDGTANRRVIPTFRLMTRSLQTIGKQAEDRIQACEQLVHCEEAISTLQWLNKRVLALLTPTRVMLFDVKKLELIEETGYFGPDFAIPRNIPLQQTFKAYKGKLFYLVGGYPLAALRNSADQIIKTAKDLRAGSVLSWADRVLHLVSTGQLVQAIDLLVLYYGGEDGEHANTVRLPLSTLELPEDLLDRQRAIEPKLKEILTASADYAFSEERMKIEAAAYQSGEARGVNGAEFFEHLVDASIRASLATGSFDFLFQNLAERYAENGIDGIFLDRLKPFILSGRIKSLPVSISQQLIARYAERDDMREVEDLIWHIDPQSLDVDQAVSLCSKHHLYEALIYVYTKALQDFIGPLVELVKLIANIVQSRETGDRRIVEPDQYLQRPQSSQDLEALVPAAYTVYTYLADSLVGLAHPSQEPLAPEVARSAKETIYDFLFARSLQAYPPGSDRIVRAMAENDSFMPYLNLLLKFDTEATLDSLDIALEDSYLDEDAIALKTPDRQAIIAALLAVLHDPSSRRCLSHGDQTFINIFIARNLPKYSQFVRLEAKTMRGILDYLATDPDLSTHSDRELAVEYLLSAYRPNYDSELLELLEEAQFFQVLASIYRAQKAWPQLASVYLRDASYGQDTFVKLSTVLRDAERNDRGQLLLVKEVILTSIPQVVNEGVSELAGLIEQHLPEDHSAVAKLLHQTPLRQMAYLRCLLEPQLDDDSTQSVRVARKHVTDDLRYMYVALLSQFDPPGVLRYLEAEPGLDRGQIINICKERENFEAIVWMQASNGEIAESIQTVRDVLQSQSELVIGGMLSHTSPRSIEQTLQHVLDVGRAAMDITGKVCRGELAAAISAEDLWYDVLSCLIDTVRDISRNSRETHASELPGDSLGVLVQVKQLIPDAISVLISSTSSDTLALPQLVRRLMDNSAESAYSDYRDILDSMLDTYRFEGNLLSTSKRLLETDVHEEVAKLVESKGTGWRPDTSGVCEACGRSVWIQINEAKRLTNPRLVVRSASEAEVAEKLKLRPKVRRRPSLKGKETNWYEEEVPKADHGNTSSESLVVFRSGAVYHAACLGQGGEPR